MSEMIKFLEGKKKFLEKDDLREFFKDEFLNGKKFIPINKVSRGPVLYKCMFEPVYGLDGKMVEQAYVVKKIDEYSNNQFLCIVDDLNKVLILNECVFIENLAIYSKYIEVTKEEKELLQEFMYVDIELVSNEKAMSFKNAFIRDSIGEYKILSAVAIHNELNNSLREYIYDNIGSFIEKIGQKEEYTEEIIKISKDFFVGRRDYEKDIFDYYQPKYLKIIQECQNRYNDNASYLYNYALNKESAIDKYVEFINNKVSDTDYIYSINQYFDARNIYILKSAKKYLEENMKTYEDDKILLEMKRLVSATKGDMKTFTVNGEKRASKIMLNYENGTISMRDVKDRYGSHWYNYDINGNVEIKYGKKTIFKTNK